MARRRCGDGNTAQAAAGELFDLRPGQLALTVTLGGLLAGNVRQFMGGLKGFGVVAQNPCGQQKGSNIQVTLDLSFDQTGHQRHSLAARNALAICTGVIVFRTIPTSHLMDMPRACGEIRIKNVRWSGAYTLCAYKN